MKRYTKQFYAIFRILVGLLFLQHGLQKLFGAFGGTAVPLASKFGVAGIIETVGGVFIILGAFTTVVALISGIEMIFAYFMAHFPKAIYPIMNGGELALLYLAAFLVLTTQGSGIWSIDSFRKKE